MDKECIEHAKAELIEAEKRKRAARQPVLTVGNYFEIQDNGREKVQDCSRPLAH